MPEPTCEADQLSYAPCKHPARFRVIRGRRDQDGQVRKWLLCGRHAAWIRPLPAWYVTELEPADA